MAAITTLLLSKSDLLTNSVTCPYFLLDYSQAKFKIANLDPQQLGDQPIVILTCNAFKVFKNRLLKVTRT